MHELKERKLSYCLELHCFSALIYVVINLCGQLQVLQDMGLPTGVELKTAESVKSEEAPAAVEDLKPVVTPVETTTAATGAANTDTTDALEV